MMATFARLFALQGSWNFDRLQGVGIAVAIEPMLRSLPGGRGGEAYRAALSRAAGYFNTHPYLAGVAVGAIARAEHDRVPGEQIERLRSALKAPLGSLGDRLIWTGALPTCVAISLVLYVSVGLLAGLLTFLVGFNAVHLTVRGWALPVGWRFGMSVASALRARLLQRSIRVFHVASLVCAGIATPLAAEWLLTGLASGAQLGALMVAVATLVTARWIAPALGASRLGVVAIVAALVVGWLWP